jgi:hypothetical protein
MMLGAFHLTRSFRVAAALAGCSHHTMAARVAEREAGRLASTAKSGVDSARSTRSCPKSKSECDWNVPEGRSVLTWSLPGCAVSGFSRSGRTVRRSAGEAKRHYSNANHGIYLDPRAGHVGRSGIGVRARAPGTAYQPVLRLAGMEPATAW